MLQIQDTLVSLDLAEVFFCCDLEKCKGECCIEGDAGAPLTEEERAYYQAMVDQINGTFIKAVAEGRGMSEAEVRKLATGLPFTGIDAVGGFDMQSGNIGDWNPYSKYAAGWTAPMVVDLQPGESAEYTIGAFEKTGDAIVIPVHADTFDGPFNEYILVDLFTAGGVNVHDITSCRLTINK